MPTFFVDFFLIFLSLILLPAFGESIPDYNNPYSPIFTDKSVYSWTDKIQIKIVSPSWNSNKNLIDSIGGTDDHAIRIATSEHSLVPYRFTETDTNSGIFTAEVILTGFEHDADGDGDIDTIPKTGGTGPTNGFLQVDRDSAITISFEFADGVVLTESVDVRWNLATIEFQEEVLFSDDTIPVRIVDADMNLNPESLDSVSAYITSDSDLAGIEINAIETSESSGIFVATFSMSQALPSSGNRLYALLGDKVIAKYNDHTLPEPFSESDNLGIETFANLGSSTPPLERLENSNIRFSDSSGNRLTSFSPNVSVQIVGTIKNPHDIGQKFVYLFQVKDSDDYVESLSWIQSELSRQQSLDVSRSWMPEKSGVYKIETFVWNSFADPTVLSPSMSATITVE